MTASLPDSARLPVWRAILGFAVLGALVTLLITAGLVYLDNFRLDGYMRTLAEQPSSAALSDTALRNSILERAHDLDLPLHSSDVQITRVDGKPHIVIAKYGVQTPLGRMDLRLPEARSR